MKNCLILLLGSWYFCAMIGGEAPPMHSIESQRQAHRDAILGQQPWSLENGFNPAERERLYQIHKSILAQTSEQSKANARQLLHGSGIAGIIGALCLWSSVCGQNSCTPIAQHIEQGAGCACILVGAFNAFRGCKECQRAREEADELAQIERKEI